MIALIDNYDSFTFNVYDYLARHAEVRVFRNTESLKSIRDLEIQKGIVISPGPSHPAKSLLSLEAVDYFKGKVSYPRHLPRHAGHRPTSSGNNTERQRSIMHGKVDTMKHFGGGLFAGLGADFRP